MITTNYTAQWLTIKRFIEALLFCTLQDSGLATSDIINIISSSPRCYDFLVYNVKRPIRIMLNNFVS